MDRAMRNIIGNGKRDELVSVNSINRKRHLTARSSIKQAVGQIRNFG
jgi:hypothetical protein